MELNSHTQSHETGNETEEAISPMDAEMNNTHQEAQSESIPGSDTSEQEKGNPPRKASYWNHLCLDTWWSEILAIIFSLACFIAIVAVLSSFDGKQSPQLAYGLTLNTIVSILATACKSSLLFLVAESIGQLKWVWFFQQGKDVRKKPLQDIQSFDGASRGPLGSLTILFRQKGLSLASLGAAITLLSLAFDPFIQQIIDYPLREVKRNSDLAVAKQAVKFDISDGWITPTRLHRSVNAGIWTDNFEVNPICPSGNCTWPSFDSVGWCSQCEDVTVSAVLVGCDNATLNITDKTNTTQHTSCNVTLPLGEPGVLPITINPKEGATKVSFPSDIVWTVNDHINQDRPSYAGVENPQFVIAHAELPWVLEGTSYDTKTHLYVRKATQCALTACSRTYNVSVSDGAPTVRTSAPNFGETFLHPSAGECWKKDKDAPVNLTQIRVSEAGTTTWKWRDTAGNALCNFDAMRFQGWFPKDLSGLFGTQNYYMKYKRAARAHRETLDDQTEEIITTSLDEVIARIANSLTKSVLDQTGVNITGTMSHTETFVAVKWKWITLPAPIVLLSSVFLLTTILINSRQKRLALWKSSVLPLLYHGIDHDKIAIPDGKEVAVVSAMEVDAKGTEVRLEESERGRLLFR